MHTFRLLSITAMLFLLMNIIGCSSTSPKPTTQTIYTDVPQFVKAAPLVVQAPDAFQNLTVPAVEIASPVPAPSPSPTVVSTTVGITNIGDAGTSSVGANDKECFAATTSLEFLIEQGSVKESDKLDLVKTALLGDVEDLLKVIRYVEGGDVKDASCQAIIAPPPEMRGVIIPLPKLGASAFAALTPEKREKVLTEYSLALIKAMKKANRRLQNILNWSRKTK